MLNLSVRRFENLPLGPVFSFIFWSDGSLAPAGTVDAPAEVGAENENHMLPITHKNGCHAMLGFDCGSAPRADTGPVGRLARWMNLI